jgi:hypothetical protein
MKGWRLKDIHGDLYREVELDKVKDLNMLAAEFIRSRVFVRLDYPLVQFFELEWDAFCALSFKHIVEYVQQGQFYVSKKKLTGVPDVRNPVHG